LPDAGAFNRAAPARSQLEIGVSNVLYVEASPREKHSFSSRVAAAFIDEYRERNPTAVIDHLQLFEDTLPEFDREAADQKMRQIVSLIAGAGSIEPIGKWAQVVREIHRLKRADKLVISSPMWNFSIPYRLKLYIDIIVQPGLTFYVDGDGMYRGLVGGKPLQLILASGSSYAARFPEVGDGEKTDFQRPYLEHVARFIGFEDIRVIKIQPTRGASVEDLPAMLDAFSREARAAARAF
jgi:FMN-dependent NADH-azoreductase